MNSPYPEVAIGSLASPEKGAFKIGPFGSSLKKAELVEDGIPVVGIENILPNQFTPPFRKFITPEKLKQLSQYKIEPFDILVTTMGTVGRSAVAPENVGPAIIDSHLFRMRVDRMRIEPAYLCYALNGYTPLTEQIKGKSVGAIMAGLNTTILRECTIPLPPLNEQLKIVDWLNEKLTIVENAHQAAEESLSAAWDLPSAYLRDIFEHLSNSEFPKRNLGDFILSYRNGFGRRPKELEKDGVIVLRLADITGGIINLDTPRRVNMSKKELEAYQVTKGDLLFVRVNGSKELVGRCAVFEDVGEPIAYNDHIIRVKLNDEIFPDYAKLITETKKVRDIIVEKASTSAGQLTINQETIGSIEIPLIPIDKQKKLVEDFSVKLKTANQFQKSLESQLAEINELPSALLRQAFAGELSA